VSTSLSQRAVRFPFAFFHAARNSAFVSSNLAVGPFVPLGNAGIPLWTKAFQKLRQHRRHALAFASSPRRARMRCTTVSGGSYQPAPAIDRLFQAVQGAMISGWIEMNTQAHEPKITIRPNPVSVRDTGMVRLGGESPSFGRAHSTPIRRSSMH
jgi:hypothetical protein